MKPALILVARLVVSVLGLSALAPAHAACYTVYRQSGAIYRSTSSPVNLSLPLSDTVPARFGPGASMVASLEELGCTELSAPNGSTLPEGISRSDSRSRSAPAPARAAARKAGGAPASLDKVFLDKSLQMRSSVGVSGATAAPAVQHPDLR